MIEKGAFWHYCDYHAIKTIWVFITTIGFFLLFLFFSTDWDGKGIDMTAKDTNTSKRIPKITPI